MPRPKAGTVRTNIYLTEEAAQILGEMAPSDRRRGQYVSELIIQAAQHTATAQSQTLTDAELLAELRRRVEELEDHLEAPGLRRLADAALAEGGEPIPVEQVLAELAV